MAVPPVLSGLRHPERSQRERTRREDRHFKFYEIPDNLIQALVALTRRLEVRGHRVSIAHLEHRSHQGRADAPGLPLGPRAEQEQVVVGLVGVSIVHTLEHVEEGLRVRARDLTQRGANLLVVFDAGRNPDRGRDDVVGRVDLSVGQVCLGDDLKPAREDLSSHGDVGIAIRQHRVVEERAGQCLGHGACVG
jgi:hypothetical protein